MWKRFIQDYFTFSQKDRLAVLVLLFLIVLVWLLPRFFPKKDAAFLQEHKAALVQAIDTIVANEPDEEKAAFEPSPSGNTQKVSLFPFDPNTLDKEGWQRLGLPDRVAKTIIKYRSKGGRFRRPEDLQKIYSLPPGFYQQVAPYIRIAGYTTPAVVETTLPEYRPSAVQREERKPVTVRINEADTTAWIALPGIGSKLAARIVNFREKLGGFCSVEQIGETYGLPDSTFQKIKGRLVMSGEVRKININTATKEELKHPYIRWQLANAIVEYRKQHGTFQQIDDLKKIALVDETIFQQIKVYVTVQ